MKLTLLGAALAGVLVVPAAPAGAAPAPVTAVHQVRGRAAVVTPGSYLTVVEKGRAVRDGGLAATKQSLVLVSPTGEQRTVYTRKVEHYRTFVLADWSVDGSTALLVEQSRDGADLTRVDVATGAGQTIHVARVNTAILDPSGTGVLASAFKSERSSTQVLEAISWSGAVTRLRVGVSGQMIAGPTGTVLTSDGKNGRLQLLLSTTTGAVVSQFRAAGYCSSVRRWDATHVLQWCKHGDLYVVDPTAGSATRLTSGHGRGDYGHLDARYIGAQLYVQVAGPCGYTYVAKVTKGSTKPLKVPGAVGSVVMVNAVGNDLVLEHAASCDGDRPRAELTTYDPATHAETPLVTLGTHEEFGGVLVLGEVRASTY
jgi:hypothetical protein